MRVTYHPQVRQDVLEASERYHAISPRLAAAFIAELKATIAKAGENPLRFHPVDQGFRRANLKRFPYHILYDVKAASIRVMIVRHHSRHPQFGLDRS
jgi:plasmid stabilization system protein ParE